MTSFKTFQHLSDSKKHHFLEAAYQEFSVHDYESASITNMVKELGIAKGSVYQYFKDKKALYEHLLTSAFEMLEELTKKACPYQPEDDFFDWFTRYLIVQSKFQFSLPQYALLFQHLEKKTEPETKEIHIEIETRWENGIIFNFPTVSYDTKQVCSLLAVLPRLIFNQFIQIHDIDIVEIVKDGAAVDISGDELVTSCTNWVKLLKHGIPT